MTDRHARLAPYRDAQRRYRPDRRALERLVADVLSSLPEPFRAKLANVAVVVEEEPTADDHRSVGLDEHDDLLGLYQGTPYGQRGTGYHLATPDRITIYRRPILALCRTEAAVREEIRATVLHEIGHYFGLSDEELN